MRDVVAEVQAEAARVRQGEAAGLDEELDAAFRRVTPDRSRPDGAAFPELLDDVRRAGFVDVSPPVQGGSAGAAAKRLVRRAIAFNLRHLAAQLGVVHGAMVDALASLDGRLRALEGVPDAAVEIDVSAADATVAELVESAPGDAVVVHGWARGGGDVVATAGALAERVGPAGLAIVVGVVPDQWATVVSPVVTDLGGLRPVHAETWVHLLAERGLADPEVRRVGPVYVVAARR